MSNLPKKRKGSPGGAPTKYKPEYCQMIIDSAKRGETFVMFASDIGVHIDTILEWAKVHKEFSVSKKLARQIQHTIFQKKYIHAMDGKIKCNPSMYIFWAKAQFGYREDSILEDDEKEIDIEFVE